MQVVRVNGLSFPLAILAMAVLVASVGCVVASAGSPPMTDAPSWLDEPTGSRAMEWVRKQNEHTLARLQRGTRYAQNYETVLSILTDERRVSPTVSGHLRDGWLYNLWTDKSHPRGVWRRARLESVLNGKPQWNVLLDLDEISRVEGKSWAFQNQPVFYGRRCLIMLSLAGSVSFSLREVDLERGGFLVGGFALPEKWMQFALWKDEDTLLVWDWDPGSVRSIREWSRGTPLSAAREVFRGSVPSDTIGATSYNDETGYRQLITVGTADTKLRSRLWKLDPDEKRVPITLPTSSAMLGVYAGEFIFQLNEDWDAGGRKWKTGTLLSVPLGEITRSPAPSTVRVLMESGSHEVVGTIAVTGGGVLVTSYENVRGRLWHFAFKDGRWTRVRVELPEYGSFGGVLSDSTGKTALVTYESFLQPTTLYAIDVATDKVLKVEQTPSQFDDARGVTEQYEAVSKDGTMVPYFIVRPKDFVPNGTASTILEGYGFLGAINIPRYNPVLGRLWLDRGGVYVQANIRGGGEFGPAWHVVRSDRQRTYEDIIAVADDLIRRKITSPRRLAVSGHSNGGLLAAVALNMRPELFHAAVISHGVLDQINPGFTQYRGNADYGWLDVPEDLAFLERTSPYQNLRPGRFFPVPFIITATNDTDVSPVASRRYAARLGQLNKPFLYFEAAEGDHGPGVTPQQIAHAEALTYTYLMEQVM